MIRNAEAKHFRLSEINSAFGEEETFHLANGRDGLTSCPKKRPPPKEKRKKKATGISHQLETPFFTLLLPKPSTLLARMETPLSALKLRAPSRPCHRAGSSTGSRRHSWPVMLHLPSPPSIIFQVTLSSRLPQSPHLPLTLPAWQRGLVTSRAGTSRRILLLKVAAAQKAWLKLIQNYNPLEGGSNLLN